MAEKRMRVFAGPNGSGKSHLFHDLYISKKFKTPYFLNADDIERSLRERGFIHLYSFGLKLKESSFSNYLTSSSLKKKAEEEGFAFNILCG